MYPKKSYADAVLVRKPAATFGGRGEPRTALTEPRTAPKALSSNVPPFAVASDVTYGKKWSKNTLFVGSTPQAGRHSPQTPSPQTSSPSISPRTKTPGELVAEFVSGRVHEENRRLEEAQAVQQEARLRREKAIADNEANIAAWKAAAHARQEIKVRQLAALEANKLNDSRTQKLVGITFGPKRSSDYSKLVSVQKKIETMTILQRADQDEDKAKVKAYFEVRDLESSSVCDMDQYSIEVLSKTLMSCMPVIHWHKGFMELKADLIAAALKPSRISRLVAEHGMEVLDNL